MADNLKKVYQGIETNERELAAYRTRLAQRLIAERGWFRPWLLLPATVIMASVFFWLFYPGPGFPQHSPEQIQDLVTHGDSERLRDQARNILAAKSDTRNRLNALMVLCLVEEKEEAVRSAAQGLLIDPRPEFRAFYLEYLLDQADEYQFNLPLIEDRMDSETDKLCFRLFRQLLHIASS